MKYLDQQIYNNEEGVVPVLVLVAIVGVLLFLAISSTFSFDNNLFDQLYQKAPSHAAGPTVPVSPTPAPVLTKVDVYLNLGTNAFALPVLPVVTLDARSIINGIVASTHATTVSIMKWEDSSWVTYNSAGQGTNFNLEPGTGYFVKTDEPGVLSLTGRVISQAPGLALKTGWNFVSFPTGSGQSAASVLNNIAGPSFNLPVKLYLWTGSSWTPAIKDTTGFSGSNFVTDIVKAYFVWVPNNGVYTASFGSSDQQAQPVFVPVNLTQDQLPPQPN